MAPPTAPGWLARLVARLRRLVGAPAPHPTSSERYRSRDGVPLRSRGEQIIANWLDARGYRWEYEARVAGYTPDFVLRDERIVIEYWGMKGASRSYDAKIPEKKRRYREHGWIVLGVERRHLARLDERLGKRLKRPPQEHQGRR